MDILLAVALLLSIFVLFNSARIRTKWFKPELSIRLDRLEAINIL